MSFIYIAATLLAAFILFSCVCRGDRIQMSKHKIGWGVLYLLYAIFAGMALLQVLDSVHIEWAEVVGLLAVACNLWLTKHLWREDVPASVKK